MRAYKAVHPAPVIGLVGRSPLLARSGRQLAGRWHPERVLRPAIGIGIRRSWVTAWTEAEPVTATEHPKNVVEGMIFHDEHDDVGNAWHGVGTRREVGVRERVRGAQAGSSQHAQRLVLRG